jgi:hypothetical protein
VNDLVKELRTKGVMLLVNPPIPDDRLRAADEIERLLEQNRLLAMDKVELRGRLAAWET